MNTPFTSANLNEVGFRYEVHVPLTGEVWIARDEHDLNHILKDVVPPGVERQVMKVTLLEKQEVIDYTPHKVPARVLPFPVRGGLRPEGSTIRFHPPPENKPQVEGERKVHQRCVSCSYEWQSRFHTDCPACHEDRFRGVEVLSVDWGV